MWRNSENVSSGRSFVNSDFNKHLPLGQKRKHVWPKNDKHKFAKRNDCFDQYDGADHSIFDLNIPFDDPWAELMEEDVPDLNIQDNLIISISEWIIKYKMADIMPFIFINILDPHVDRFISAKISIPINLVDFLDSSDLEQLGKILLEDFPSFHLATTISVQQILKVSLPSILAEYLQLIHFSIPSEQSNNFHFGVENESQINVNCNTIQSINHEPHINDLKSILECHPWLSMCPKWLPNVPPNTPSSSIIRSSAEVRIDVSYTPYTSTFIEDVRKHEYSIVSISDALVLASSPSALVKGSEMFELKGCLCNRFDVTQHHENKIGASLRSPSNGRILVTCQTVFGSFKPESPPKICSICAMPFKSVEKIGETLMSVRQVIISLPSRLLLKPSANLGKSLEGSPLMIPIPLILQGPLADSPPPCLSEVGCRVSLTVMPSLLFSGTTAKPKVRSLLWCLRAALSPCEQVIRSIPSGIKSCIDYYANPFLPVLRLRYPPRPDCRGEPFTLRFARLPPSYLPPPLSQVSPFPLSDSHLQESISKSFSEYDLVDLKVVISSSLRAVGFKDFGWNHLVHVRIALYLSLWSLRMQYLPIDVETAAIWGAGLTEATLPSMNPGDTTQNCILGEKSGAILRPPSQGSQMIGLPYWCPASPFGTSTVHSETPIRCWTPNRSQGDWGDSQTEELIGMGNGLVTGSRWMRHLPPPAVGVKEGKKGSERGVSVSSYGGYAGSSSVVRQSSNALANSVASCMVGSKGVSCRSIIDEKKFRPIHILLIGDDKTVMSRLIHSALATANENVRSMNFVIRVHSPSVLLNLSPGGVALIDLESNKRGDMLALMHIMQKFTVASPVVKNNESDEVPLRVAFWATLAINSDSQPLNAVKAYRADPRSPWPLKDVPREFMHQFDLVVDCSIPNGSVLVTKIGLPSEFENYQRFLAAGVDRLATQIVKEVSLVEQEGQLASSFFCPSRGESSDGGSSPLFAKDPLLVSGNQKKDIFLLETAAEKFAPLRMLRLSPSAFHLLSAAEKEFKLHPAHMRTVVKFASCIGLVSGGRHGGGILPCDISLALTILDCSRPIVNPNCTDILLGRSCELLSAALRRSTNTNRAIFRFRNNGGEGMAVEDFVEVDKGLIQIGDVIGRALCDWL